LLFNSFGGLAVIQAQLPHAYSRWSLYVANGNDITHFVALRWPKAKRIGDKVRVNRVSAKD